MNTYIVTYWPPLYSDAATTPPPPITDTVQAVGFQVEQFFVVFVDATGNPVKAVPVHLNPVVALTATA